MAARSSLRIFVANLPWTVGNQELRHHFAEFGHITSAKVIFDRNTGMSRGYGFVSFSNESAVSNVYNKQSHVLEGNQLSLNNAQQLNDQ
jgi:RNA recognition motif-containing protein